MPSCARHRYSLKSPPSGVAAAHPHRDVGRRHHFFSSSSSLSSAGICGQRLAAVTLELRRPAVADDQVDLAPVGRRHRDSPRGCGRRGSPCARAPPAATASETVSMECEVERQVPAGVVTARPPSTAHARGALPERRDLLERLLELALGADDARPGSASSPGDRRGWRTGSRRRCWSNGSSSLPGDRLDLARVHRRRRPRLFGVLAPRASPARRPKTRRSESELPPRRLAPCMPPAHLAGREEAGHRGRRACRRPRARRP